MLAAEVIRGKRDGRALSAEEVRFLVAGITDGSLSDAQVGALAMALFLRGMEPAERVALTEAMTQSGAVLDWDLDRPVLDKHSTGGVGDKVSLMLAPIVAACGGAVPMISGRGLGHTGGTLDKLDAVPGYDTRPDLDRLRAVVDEVGCAIVGQTAELAPADRRLYAVRDATGTVESIPLIVASILSKKLAAGLDALVMDVKFGSGAFMAEREAADELALALVEVARGAGLPTVALLTDMDEVLGSTAGNALEVLEAIDYLTGAAREPRLHEVTRALAASLLVQGGLAGDEEAAGEKVDRALDSGAATERFAAMVAALGGPADFAESPDLPAASVIRAVAPDRPGVVSGIDCRAVGLVVTGLGGNRRREDDVIDPAVGLTEVAPVGAEVGPDRPLAVVHAADEAAADEAAAALRAAVTVAAEPPERRPVVAGRVA
ncbi:MAG TPA: thymidine phosphorylase [Solirubrobacteraceae bacterium]|jgi:thymidine phosphorylase|nr:thymidine phosphorylase [Solirubrobacteraceae bacterium]